MQTDQTLEIVSFQYRTVYDTDKRKIFHFNILFKSRTNIGIPFISKAAVKRLNLMWNLNTDWHVHSLSALVSLLPFYDLEYKRNIRLTYLNDYIKHSSLENIFTLFLSDDQTLKSLIGVWKTIHNIQTQHYVCCLILNYRNWPMLHTIAI